MGLVRFFPYEDVSTTSGRKPIADATNCTRTHSTALSRAARLLSRARPLTSTLVAGAQQKKKVKRERKNKNKNEEGLELGTACNKVSHRYPTLLSISAQLKREAPDGSGLK